MSDSTTDKRSSTKYLCSVCNKSKYYEDFCKDWHSDDCLTRPLTCLECYIERFPTGLTVPSKYLKNEMKFDKDKLQFNLVPPEAELWLAEILTHGAKKYKPNGWKEVESHRYLAALKRHLNAWQRGEKLDPDSGFCHLKHVLTNALFLCYLDNNKKELL